MLAGLVGRPSPSPPARRSRRRRTARLRRRLRRPGHVRQRAVPDGPGRVGLHRRRAGPAAPRRLPGRRRGGRRAERRCMVEALHEVVNVLSALFNTPGAPHSKLHKLYAPGEELAGRHGGHARRLQPHRPRRRGPGLRQGRDSPSSCSPRRPPPSAGLTAALRGPPGASVTAATACPSRPGVARWPGASGAGRLAGPPTVVGRQAQTCLEPSSTYQPCATDSRATRCRPMPPCAGSRSTAGAGIDVRRPVADVEQPAAAAGDDRRDDRALAVPQRVGRQLVEGQDQLLGRTRRRPSRGKPTSSEPGAQAGPGGRQLGERPEVPAPHLAPAVRQRAQRPRQSTPMPPPRSPCAGHLGVPRAVPSGNRRCLGARLAAVTCHPGEFRPRPPSARHRRGCHAAQWCP